MKALEDALAQVKRERAEELARNEAAQKEILRLLGEEAKAMGLYELVARGTR